MKTNEEDSKLAWRFPSSGAKLWTDSSWPWALLPFSENIHLENLQLQMILRALEL